MDILEKYRAKINYSEDEFVLTIETTGQLTTQEIIESAIKEITIKLEEIEEGIKKL